MKNNKIICIIISLIVIVSACFAACSGNNHNANEKDATITGEDGQITTSDENDSGNVTVVQNVTNKAGKVIGTKKVNMPTSIKDGKVVVTRIETVTDKNGKNITTIISQTVTDNSGKEITVNKSTTKKGSDNKTNTKTTAPSKGKKTTTKKSSTTSDPCTTKDPHTVENLPEDVFEEGYLLSESNGLYYLQQRFDILEKGRYIVNLDGGENEIANYTVYVPRPNNEKGHIVYSTVKVNLKTGKATETNAKTKKKTKYDVTVMPTTTTTKKAK